MRDEDPYILTRRDFVHWVGRTGGASAAYATLCALGLLPLPAAYAGPPQLPSPSRNVRIAVLGAGVAGLTAAYELGRAGYDCTVYEAQQRAGGKSQTIRGGDRVVETAAIQQAQWPDDEHLYFNPGAARISHHHHAVLGYCKAFGVPIQVFINENRNALLQHDGAMGGRPVRTNQVVADTRGHVAELLAKTTQRNALAQPLSEEDQQRLLELLRNFGALGDDFTYRGSRRSSYTELPGSGLNFGRIQTPLPLSALLATPQWQEAAWLTELLAQTSPMFEPVGGMDRLVDAFVARLPPIRYGCICTHLRRHGETGATVEYRDDRTGENAAETFDYVVVTIPLPVLAGIANDFTPSWQDAIGAAHYVPCVKIGLYAPRRFWEEDERIYGGASWTSQDITQMWYPSAGLQESGGILVGAYIWTSDVGERFSRLPPQQRISAALLQGQRLHPHLAEEASHGVAVAWRNMPYAGGAWHDWSDDDRLYRLPALGIPDWPYILAGDHVSTIPGWQEGAVLAAQDAVREIAWHVAAR